MSIIELEDFSYILLLVAIEFSLSFLKNLDGCKLSLLLNLFAKLTFSVLLIEKDSHLDMVLELSKNSQKNSLIILLFWLYQKLSKEF